MELETGVPHVYRLKPDSTVDTKEILDPKAFSGISTLTAATIAFPKNRTAEK
jgi:hypothetical protein